MLTETKNPELMPRKEKRSIHVSFLWVPHPLSPPDQVRGALLMPALGSLGKVYEMREPTQPVMPGVHFREGKSKFNDFAKLNLLEC